MYHLVLVREAAGTHSWYLNGNLAYTDTRCWIHNVAMTVNTTANGALRLGGYGTFATLFGFRQWSTAFTAAQVLESYTYLRTAR